MFCTPQIQTVPAIRWDDLETARLAHAVARPDDRYAGHLPDGSSVQAHSADFAYAKHGLVMVLHECRGRRLWHAMQGNLVIAAHPKHDGARFMALALLTGA